MNNFEEYWIDLVEKNPNLKLDDSSIKIKLSTKELKIQLQKAFDVGSKSRANKIIDKASKYLSKIEKYIDNIALDKKSKKEQTEPTDFFYGWWK